MRKENFAPVRFRADGSAYQHEDHFDKSLIGDLFIALMIVVIVFLMFALALFQPSGLAPAGQPVGANVGGPAWPLDENSVNAFEATAFSLEKSLQASEANLVKERNNTVLNWPVAGELTDGFGNRRNPFGGATTEFHAGQDISTASGTPVTASADGAVAFAGWQRGYGHIVIIDHGDNLTTRYAHLSQIDAVNGQTIKRGEQLGQVGSTGRSTGPHLHYEVRVDEQPVNPLMYLPINVE